MTDQGGNDGTVGRRGQKWQRSAFGVPGPVIGVLPFLVTVLILQIGLATRAVAIKPSEQQQRDSYAIYSMLLKLDEWRVHSPILGIQQETRVFRPVAGVGEPACDWPEPSAEGQQVYGPLIEDFKRRNSRPVVLEERFDLPSYRLLTVREVGEVGKKYPVVPPPPGTRGSVRQNPRLNGINVVFFLSAVGFSADHARALVYIATWTGGRYYFLVRRHGRWAIDNDYHGTVCSWVS